MSNTLNLLSEETFSEKMDNLILAVHGQGSEVEITTWKQVQSIVRAGLASKYYSVGDKFVAEKETAVNATSSNSSLSISVNADKFLEKTKTAGNSNFEFTYDGLEWKDEDGASVVLSNYGVTCSGSPVKDDKILVHETAAEIEFIIMGFDQETPVDTTRTHSMTLAMNYTYTGVVFDAREAFYYNGTSAALPSGTYHFTLANQDWYGADAGKTFQFTLTQNLPVGGQLVFNQAYNATLAGNTISVYASGSATTATETVTVTEGSSGTDLGTVKNAMQADAYLNHSQRAIMGNNRWSQSAIRQWCNANGAKGTFWVPKNGWDRAPSWHSSTGLDGFLYELDPSLVAVLGKCSKDCELASCDIVSGGDSHEKTEDTVWLLDRYEIQSCSASEANTYPPYTYWHNLLGDTYGDWRTDSRFIKLNAKGGSAQYWWLRSPYTGGGTSARLVYTSGGVDASGAIDGRQAAVAFAII